MKYLFPAIPCHLLVLLALIQYPLHAQRRWDKATIVLNNNDTVQGEIAVKRKAKIFESIVVKNSKGVMQEYFPLDVLSFTIHGVQEMYFKTFFTETDFSEIELDKIDNNREIKLVKDTVFAQLLLGGSNKLYYFEDRRRIKSHFLIEKPDGTVIELVDKEYYINDNRNSVATNAQYKKTLLELYPNSKATIEQLPFTRTAIVAFLKSNDLAESPKRIAYQWEKTHYQFGLTAGMAVSLLHLYGDSEFMNALKFKSSNKINGGISVNIVLPEHQKNWSIYTELLYSSYNFETEGGYEQFENNNWYNKMVNTTVASQYVKFYTAVRRQAVQRFSPFFQLGIANGYSFKSSFSSTYEHRFYSALYLDKTSRKTRKFEQSAFLGTGICYKHIGLEARYEIGTGLGFLNSVNTLNNYLHLLISYHL